MVSSVVQWLIDGKYTVNMECLLSRLEQKMLGESGRIFLAGFFFFFFPFILKLTYSEIELSAV